MLEVELVERSVDDVIAHAVYDPVARRQRYLKNRQLKGRQPGIVPIKVGQGSRVVDLQAPNTGLHASRAKKIAADNAAASQARQVAAIKAKLADLKAQLNKLLVQAKADQKSSASKSSTTKKSTAPSKPKTAAQKAAAKKSLAKAQKASAAAKKAAPNQPAKPTPTARTPQEQISHLRTVISDTEAKLRAAIESTRQKTASNGR